MTRVKIISHLNNLEQLQIKQRKWFYSYFYWFLSKIWFLPRKIFTKISEFFSEFQKNLEFPKKIVEIFLFFKIGRFSGNFQNRTFFGKILKKAGEETNPKNPNQPSAEVSGKLAI